MMPLWVQLVGGAAYLGLEYWLGKTDKVKAGSVAELALNALALVFKRKL